MKSCLWGANAIGSTSKTSPQAGISSSCTLLPCSRILVLPPSQASTIAEIARGIKEEGSKAVAVLTVLAKPLGVPQLELEAMVLLLRRHELRIARDREWRLANPTLQLGEAGEGKALLGPLKAVVEAREREMGDHRRGVAVLMEKMTAVAESSVGVEGQDDDEEEEEEEEEEEDVSEMT